MASTLGVVDWLRLERFLEQRLAMEIDKLVKADLNQIQRCQGRVEVLREMTRLRETLAAVEPKEGAA